MALSTNTGAFSHNERSILRIHGGKTQDYNVYLFVYSFSWVPSTVVQTNYTGHSEKILELITIIMIIIIMIIIIIIIIIIINE